MRAHAGVGKMWIRVNNEDSMYTGYDRLLYMINTKLN